MDSETSREVERKLFDELRKNANSGEYAILRKRKDDLEKNNQGSDSNIKLYKSRTK